MKKILSFILAALMTVSAVGVTAFADGTSGGSTAINVSETEKQYIRQFSLGENTEKTVETVNKSCTLTHGDKSQDDVAALKVSPVSAGDNVQITYYPSDAERIEAADTTKIRFVTIKYKCTSWGSNGNKQTGRMAISFNNADLTSVEHVVVGEWATAVFKINDEIAENIGELRSFGISPFGKNAKQLKDDNAVYIAEVIFSEKDPTVTENPVVNEETFKVTYKFTDSDGNDKSESTTITKNGKHTISAYTGKVPNNKVFSVWRTADGQEYAVGSKIDVTSDMTLTAVFTDAVEEFTVTYKLPYATEAFKTETVTNGATITIASLTNDKIPENFKFIGWTANDGKTYNKNDAVTVESDMTFTAVFERLTHAITFKIGEESITIDGSMSAPYGLEYTIPGCPKNVLPEGRAFVKWEANVNGETIAYMPGGTVTIDKDTVFTAALTTIVKDINTSKIIMYCDNYKNNDKIGVAGFMMNLAEYKHIVVTFKPDTATAGMKLNYSFANGLSADSNELVPDANYADYSLAKFDIPEGSSGLLNEIALVLPEGVASTYVERIVFYKEDPRIKIHKDTYINGSKNADGTVSFNPAGNMTRAEAATIIARLAAYGDEYVVISPNYSIVLKDVAQDKWYYKYVAYIEKEGYLKAYTRAEEKLFKPEEPITRAEFIDLVYQLAYDQNLIDNSKDCNSEFSDIATNIRKGVITLAAKAGLITGYDNGDGSFSFKPDGTITRSEVVTVINRLFGQDFPATGVKAETVPASAAKNFGDVPADFWARFQIIESAVPHIEDVNGWLVCIKNPDEVFGAAAK